MSGPDIHVTGYLGTEDHAAVFRFIDAAARLEVFREIIPVRRQDSRIIAITFVSSDCDEDTTPWIAARLSGILRQDITIASAWAEPGDDRQYAQVIRGGARETVRGEVIREPPALTA